MIYSSKDARRNRRALAQEKARIAANKPARKQQPLTIIKGYTEARAQAQNTPAQAVTVELPSEHVAPARRTTDEQPDLFDAVRRSFNQTLRAVQMRGRVTV